MKLLQLFLLSTIVASCGIAKSDKTLDRTSNVGRIKAYNTDLYSSSALSTNLTHIASIAPMVINGKKLQATNFKKIGTTNYALVTYNYAGDEIYGGLDILDLSTNVKLGQYFYSTADYEFADAAIKDNIAYVVGQKKNDDGNKAVIVSIDLSNINSLTILDELAYDGYYATSISIKDNQAFITIPSVGVKVINIANPSDLVAGTFTPSSGGSSGSLIPASITLTHRITSEWANGYNYEVRLENNTSTAISNWKMCFTYNYPVGNSGIYNAQIVSGSAQPNWIIAPMSYNQIIYPGSNVTLGWQSNVPVNGNLINNIQVLINANANSACSNGAAVVSDYSYLSNIDRPLFIGLFNDKLTTLGGTNKTQLVYEASTLNVLSTSQEDAPARFYTNSGYIYTNGGRTGLRVLNTAHSQVFQSSVAGLGNGISGEGNLLLLAQGDLGTMLYDITNKEAPVYLESLDFIDDSGSANNISIIQSNSVNYGFLSDGLAGIKVIKITH